MQADATSPQGEYRVSSADPSFWASGNLVNNPSYQGEVLVGEEAEREVRCSLGLCVHVCVYACMFLCMCACVCACMPACVCLPDCAACESPFCCEQVSHKMVQDEQELWEWWEVALPAASAPSCANPSLFRAWIHLTGNASSTHHGTARKRRAPKFRCDPAPLV